MDNIWDAVQQHIWWLFAAIGGRLMFHTREAQAGRRKFWGKDLALELPVAVAMGMVGYSIAEWLGVSGTISAGLISAVAYLGPRAIDTLFDRASKVAGDVFGKKP